jgi:hypothetical protein
MGWVRNFSQQEGHLPPTRNVEDAPPPMRQELLDAICLVASRTNGRLNPDGDLYFTISQSFGFQAAGNPMGGRRQRLGRDIANVEWPRVYDLLARLWPEFRDLGFQEVYRGEVNRVLAAYGVAWDLGTDGRLHRVLPPAAQTQINAAFTELGVPRYAPALALFMAARDAYDDRPRRDRDACANVFDAMESVAKEKYQRPQATFGNVVAHIRQTQALNEQIIAVLETINTLRNRNFGHGLVAPFSLNPTEVDFTYLVCVGAILMFTRTP